MRTAFVQVLCRNLYVHRLPGLCPRLLAVVCLAHLSYTLKSIENVFACPLKLLHNSFEHHLTIFSNSLTINPIEINEIIERYEARYAGFPIVDSTLSPNV